MAGTKAKMSPAVRVLLALAVVAMADRAARIGGLGAIGAVNAEPQQPQPNPMTVVPASPHLQQHPVYPFYNPYWNAGTAGQQMMRLQQMAQPNAQKPLAGNDYWERARRNATGAAKEHLPDCKALKERGLPCPPGAVVLEADGDETDGITAVIHLPSPPEPGTNAEGPQDDYNKNTITEGGDDQQQGEQLSSSNRESEDGPNGDDGENYAVTVTDGQNNATETETASEADAGDQSNQLADPAFTARSPGYPMGPVMGVPQWLYAGAGMQPQMYPGAMSLPVATFGDEEMMMGGMGEMPGMMGMEMSTMSGQAPTSLDNPTGEVPHDINWMLRGPNNLDNSQLERYMFEIARFFSDRCRLEAIGHSVQNRTIYSIVLCKNRRDCRQRPNLKPKVRLAANLRGNHGTSRALLAFLIEYLLSYQEVNPRVNRLLSSTEIHIIPSVNLDGFENAYDDWKRLRLYSNVSEGLTNANGVDLERDYPRFWEYRSIQDKDYWNREPETTALMKYSHEELFVLSGTFSDDDVIVRVPLYDHIGNYTDGIESRPPDFDVFHEIGMKYAEMHPLMREYGFKCPGDPHRQSIGVENGAYALGVTPGHPADWHYKFANAFDFWIHISCFGFSNEESLEQEWQKNVNPMMTFLESAHMGVKGMVWENKTGAPMDNVLIEVRYRRHRIRTNERGEYWRLLNDGVYYMRPYALGFNPCEWEPVVVINSMGPTLKHFYLQQLSLD